MTNNINIIITGNQVCLAQPTIDFADEFILKANNSKNIHSPWTQPPLNQKEYEAYLNKISLNNQEGFFILTIDKTKIAGVININEIVRGCFQSGYLGYYIFQDFEKKGFMTEALSLVITYAFNTLQLHRLEANIQPTNTASINLIKNLNFVEEGYSKKYLKINNEWQDHIRFAKINDNTQL